MMLKLKPSLCIIAASILFFGCQHELGFDPSKMSSTAVFSFYGSPDTCAYSIVTGSYKTGTSLGNANKVTIGVDVRTVGIFNVSTSAVNGIKFTGFGTFSATGLQTISLMGSGTPASPGIFSYAVGSNGCSFPVTIVDGTIIGSAIFTYDGTPNSCTDAGIGGNYKVGNSLNETHKVRIGVNILRVGNYNITTALINGISFSGTGNLPNLGYGVVDLVGSGTPIAEGTFHFTPSNNGCLFPVRVSP